MPVGICTRGLHIPEPDRGCKCSTDYKHVEKVTVSSVKHSCLTGNGCNRSTNKHGKHKALHTQAIQASPVTQTTETTQLDYAPHGSYSLETTVPILWRGRKTNKATPKELV